MNTAYKQPVPNAAPLSSDNSSPLPKSLRVEEATETVTETLLVLCRHPLALVVYRWHWKSALLSALVRGTLFFVVTLKAGLGAALAAMRLEALIYAALSGFYGALIQSFRRAKPAWAATLVVMFLLPLINHALEFAIHTARGTPRLGRGMLFSVGLSLLSACFNLFAMRRGVFIVGAERYSLLTDLRRTPHILWQFVSAIPIALLRLAKISAND